METEEEWLTFAKDVKSSLLDEATRNQWKNQERSEKLTSLTQTGISLSSKSLLQTLRYSQTHEFLGFENGVDYFDRVEFE